MRLTIDPRANVAYLRFREKTVEVETIRVSEDVNVDLAPDGTVYGIELLNAKAQLAADPSGNLTLVNEASGESCTIKLSA